MRLLLSILYILTILSSCYRDKEIEIDFPYDEKIAVYGFIGNEDGSYVQVFNNALVTEENPDFTNSTALTYLVENGIRVDTFAKDSEGKHRSNYPISEANDYIVEVNDNGQWYTSEEVILEKENFIEDIEALLDTNTNKIYIEILLHHPFERGDKFVISSKHNGQDIDITYSTEDTNNDKLILIILSARNPVFGPNHEILDVIELTSADIEFTFHSYEVGRFSESRSGLSGEIGDGNAPYRKPWTNVPGALGYVTSYYQDSVHVEF